MKKKTYADVARRRLKGARPTYSKLLGMRR